MTPETIKDALQLVKQGKVYDLGVPYDAQSFKWPGHNPAAILTYRGPEGVKRLDPWKWKDNPFVGTDQLQGLKIMQVFMTNYDLLDLQNQVLKVNGPNGPELHYIISDLGSTFGKFGSNNLPLFFRLGRANDKPRAWNKAKFITGVKDGKIKFALTGAKNRGWQTRFHRTLG